jgi:hypothetical protein
VCRNQAYQPASGDKVGALNRLEAVVIGGDLVGRVVSCDFAVLEGSHPRSQLTGAIREDRVWLKVFREKIFWGAILEGLVLKRGPQGNDFGIWAGSNISQEFVLLKFRVSARPLASGIT